MEKKKKHLAALDAVSAQCKFTFTGVFVIQKVPTEAKSDVNTSAHSEKPTQNARGAKSEDVAVCITRPEVAEDAETEHECRRFAEDAKQQKLCWSSGGNHPAT